MGSSGQEWALQQLELIEKASNGYISYRLLKEPSETDSFLRVIVSILCKEFEQIEGGFQLNQREEVEILIPKNFPYSVPEVYSRHRRFRGHPHVQWGNYFCLYQAKNVEWSPSDGMYGLIERLVDFLENGAKNQLDAIGGPIHPPVAYSSSSKKLITSIDAPKFADSFWLGFAEIQKINDATFEVIAWTEELDFFKDKNIVPVFLFKEKLPNEFPTTLDALIKSIEFPDVLISILLAMLRIASSNNQDKVPLFTIIGTPMRGTVGSQEQIMHLAAWQLPEEIKSKITVGLENKISKNEVEKVAESTGTEIKETLQSSKLDWVNILENRPEIVVSRASNSIFATIKNKNICLIGAGAIGSFLGELLVREGISSLCIIDNKSVKPGIICRQNFEMEDIGQNKAVALKERLNLIAPKIPITEYAENIVSLISSKNLDLGSFDLVIDASASNIVTQLLSQSEVAKAVPDLISIVINHNASAGLLVLKPKNSKATVHDLFRSVKVKSFREDVLIRVRKNFWPEERGVLFQPEPGCSEPTFSGSYSDILLLINSLFREAVASNFKSSCFQYATVSGGTIKVQTELISEQKIYSEEYLGYEICISNSAENQYQRHIKYAISKRGKDKETGGLIFGTVDNLNKRIYIDYISDAPLDSSFHKDAFICGTKGVAELQASIQKNYGIDVGFIGSWHTHPFSEAKPSTTDRDAASTILNGTNSYVKRVLIMIISYDEKNIAPRFFYFEDFNE